MYRIVICENDIEHAQHLGRKISACGQKFRQQALCADLAALQNEIGKNGQIDILFMDIRLDQENGIDVVNSLLHRDDVTQVIYVTGYPEYCTAVYDSEHIGFLIKPVQSSELKAALRRAEDRLQHTRKNGITIQNPDGIRLLPASKIYFIESSGRKILFHMWENTYTCYGTLNDIERKLDQSFYRCHKSFLVNLRHVQALQNRKFLLENKAEVPISARHQAESKQRFLDYLGRSLTLNS